jgi:hypothetical protein
MFTSFFGTTMTFRIVLPAMNCCTFSERIVFLLASLLVG